MRFASYKMRKYAEAQNPQAHGPVAENVTTLRPNGGHGYGL